MISSLLKTCNSTGTDSSGNNGLPIKGAFEIEWDYHTLSKKGMQLNTTIPALFPKATNRISKILVTIIGESSSTATIFTRAIFRFPPPTLMPSNTMLTVKGFVDQETTKFSFRFQQGISSWSGIFDMELNWLEEPAFGDSTIKISFEIIE